MRSHLLWFPLWSQAPIFIKQLQASQHADDVFPALQATLLRLILADRHLPIGARELHCDDLTVTWSGWQS